MSALHPVAGGRREAPGDIRWLKPVMLAVDLAFLAYWTVIALGVLPPGLRFTGYEDPVMVAWNWSFLPLDLAASLTGIAAVAWQPRSAIAGRVLLPVSLALTAAAGGMAIGFWTLVGWFEATWWIPNLALLAVGVLGLVALARRTTHLAAVLALD